MIFAIYKHFLLLTRLARAGFKTAEEGNHRLLYRYGLLHRCTRVENPGEGVRDVFAKFPRGGGQGFQEKLPGGSTYFAFYCIFINKFFENLPGGVLFHTPPPPLTPPCVHLCSCRSFYLFLEFAFLFLPWGGPFTSL